MKTSPTVTLSRFLGHPELLGKDFADDSWSAWRTVLKAAFAEDLSDDELDAFRELADGRDPPSRRVRELWLAIGRRAGKDSIASAIATYLAAFGKFKPHLRRGERATILCLACTREQASIVHGYIRANFESIPALKTLLVSAQNDVITLNNGIEIVVAAASFRHLRGKTVAAAIFDECAFWADENSSNPATEIYNAVLPSMITLRDAGAVLIGISTVHRRSGLLFDKISEFRAKNSDDGLAILARSTAFNPKLLEPEAQSEIDRQLALDPAAASAEWLSIWRDDLTDLFDRELVLSAVDPERLVSPPRPGISYVLAADASGGRGDAFTSAIGHRENDVIVIDRVDEWRPPFDADAVISAIADIARYYRTATVHHDDWGADLLTQSFRRHGLTSKSIAVRASGKDFKLTRSEIYVDVLPLFTAHRIRLPDNPRLIHQLCLLERRPAASGRDVVDHPKSKGSHDDIANAACAAAVLVASQTRLKITREHVARASQPAGSIQPTTSRLPVSESDPEWWRNATPQQKMAASTRPPWEQETADAPPERRHSLYISNAMMNRARSTGAWSNRADNFYFSGNYPGALHRRGDNY